MAAQVAKRLNEIAIRDETVQSFNELKLDGAPAPVFKEDENLWKCLTKGKAGEDDKPQTELRFRFVISNVEKNLPAALALQRYFREVFRPARKQREAEAKAKAKANKGKS
jgi:hypothetical protein